MENNGNEILTQTGKTQAQILGEKLKAIEPNVTASDRAEFFQLVKNNSKEKVSAPTLRKYFNGEGPDPETAINLFVWFNAKIMLRERRMKEALAQ